MNLGLLGKQKPNILNHCTLIKKRIIIDRAIIEDDNGDPMKNQILLSRAIISSLWSSSFPMNTTNTGLQPPLGVPLFNHSTTLPTYIALIIV